MKTILHNSESRGFVDHGWLQANHSFSFANFYDKEKINFGALRVLNDDIIAPKMGFGTHPHDNMEIITIPLSGELKHRDSMHNSWQSVYPDEVQVMSAGKGIEHSEINGSLNEHLRLFQIWIIPNKMNIEPRYDQKKFSYHDRKNTFQVLVSSFLDDNRGLKIHQDAKLSRINLDAGKRIDYQLKSRKHGVYIMTIDGMHNINQIILNKRDALGVYDTDKFTINALEMTELLLIEVPML